MESPAVLRLTTKVDIGVAGSVDNIIYPHLAIVNKVIGLCGAYK